MVETLPFLSGQQRQRPIVFSAFLEGAGQVVERLQRLEVQGLALHDHLSSKGALSSENPARKSPR
jgi:hypothetical protein